MRKKFVTRGIQDNFSRYRTSPLFHSTVVNVIVTYEIIKQITGRKYQRYVCYHVYHARHVHCIVRNVVILRYNVRNNTVLNPLHGVAGAVHHEEYEDLPSSFVDSDFLQSNAFILDLSISHQFPPNV